MSEAKIFLKYYVNSISWAISHALLIFIGLIGDGGDVNNK